MNPLTVIALTAYAVFKLLELRRQRDEARAERDEAQNDLNHARTQLSPVDFDALWARIQAEEAAAEELNIYGPNDWRTN